MMIVANNNEIVPIYADAGRKERVEFFDRLAHLNIHEHCLVTGSRYEPLANDRLSTRESCMQPDCLINGIPTELKMWQGWKSGEFPQHLPVQIPAGSMWMRDAYETGRFVMVNMDGTNAVSVSFDVEPKKMVKTKSHSHESGTMFAAQYDLSQCKQFKLGKIRKELN